MRLFFILVVFLFSRYLCIGSHIAGGEITYKYVGDSTGVLHQYSIRLKLFRENDVNNAPLTSTQKVFLTSSCYPDTFVTVWRIPPPPNLVAGDGGFLIKDFGICANDTNFIAKYSTHYYESVFKLPGTCSDWVIFNEYNCCRNNAINNLINPGSASFLISASLDNSKGPNNTPTGSFADDVRIYCVGSNVSIIPFTEEPDGDSLHYKLAPVRGGTGPIGMTIPYDSAYSFSNPISSSTPITINPITGIINFSPSQIEVCVIAVLVEEWRTDTITGMPYIISEMQKDMQIIISGNCDTMVRNWSLSHQNASDPYLRFHCGDSILKLKSPVPFRCNSLSPDGTDFRITDLKGTVVKIDSVSTPCANKTYGDSIFMFLDTQCSRIFG